jgi:hypothetical protein
MKRTTFKRTAVALGALLGLLLLTSVALAQEGGPYDLSWSTVDGGGYTFSSGGDYELGGTIGQPDTGCMEGGSYLLCGGFWPGSAVEPRYPAYIPLVLKRY